MGKKLTYEDVKNYIEVESGSGCKLLSEEYISSKEKLKLLCSCSNEFEVSYNQFQRDKKYQCNNCGREKARSEKNKKSNNDFVMKIYDLIENEYSFLDNYKDSKTKIKVMHNTENCGYIWKVSPNNFLRGSRCPKCSGKMKKTTKDFIEEVYDLTGNDYTVIGEYKNAHTKIKIKHNKCGKEYYIRPMNFLNGSRCVCDRYKRSASKLAMSNEEFRERIYELYGNDYNLLSYYTNAHTKIDVEHVKCGYRYKVFPYSLLSGFGCSKCGRKKAAKSTSMQIDDVIKKLNSLVKNDYDLIEYHGKLKKKATLRHNICGHTWGVNLGLFFSGTRCPKCNQYSKGEDKINKSLKGIKIQFSTQYKFENCINIRPLPFDFAIFDNYELIFLIEFDGGQHFQPIDYYGGEEKLNYRQTNDQIKNQYCTENNIPLIRIPYWEYDNIELILDNVLQHFNIIDKTDTYNESLVKQYLVNDENWSYEEYIKQGQNLKTL